MVSKAAALHDDRSFGDRTITQGDFRRATRFLAKQSMTCIAAVTAVGTVGIAVTLAAAWIASGSLSAGHHATRSMGPGALALVQHQPAFADAGGDSFADKWARVPGAAQIVAVPQQAAPKTALAKADEGIPLPRRHPASLELARAPETEAPAKSEAKTPTAPQVAIAVPPSFAPKEPVLPDGVSRTAVYDITGSVVHMPDGSKLEAHSGLGDRMDDPRHIKLRMRGPTPPNVYVLTEREALFHGVRAVRLNPVNRDKMFGRDGMLAHTYMLGPNGQSNGCVSFKDYRKFLTAFLDGKVDKLVVVDSLRGASWRTAALQAEGVPAASRRFAGSYSRPRAFSRIFGGSDDDDGPRYASALGFSAERANW